MHHIPSQLFHFHMYVLNLFTVLSVIIPINFAFTDV